MNKKYVATFYTDDHDRLDELFQQFQRLKPTDPSTAVVCFKQFAQGLQQHIAWEEQILFPAFEERTGMHSGGPTHVMRLEHQQIQNLLGLISLALQEGKADTDQQEATLLEVLNAHNMKEEQILYPAIDQMLGEPERAEVFARMGVGDNDETTLDVRHLRPAQRHPLIFQAFESLEPGEYFVLVNDHDPKPLYYQFAAEHAGLFTWEYLEQGLQVWRVRIGRITSRCVAEGI